MGCNECRLRYTVHLRYTHTHTYTYRLRFRKQISELEAGLLFYFLRPRNGFIAFTPGLSFKFARIDLFTLLTTLKGLRIDDLTTWKE